MTGASLIAQLQGYFSPSHCHLQDASWSQLQYPGLLLLLQSALLLHTSKAQSLRIFVAVVNILVTLRISLAYRFTEFNTSHPESEIKWLANSYNTVWVVNGCWIIGKTIEFALSKNKPRLALSDNPREDNGNRNHSTESSVARKPPRPFFYPHTWIPLCVDLIINTNGYGWEHGKYNSKSKAGYATVQPPTLRFDRRGRRFLLSRLVLLPITLFLYLLNVCLVSHPRFLATFDFPPGSKSFLPEPVASSPLLTRVVRGFLACISASLGIPSGFLFAFSSLSIVHFIIDPRAQVYWDTLPTNINAWQATSLHDLWSNRWHTLMMRVWYFNGYLPVHHVSSQWLKLPGKVSRSLGIFGIFTLSGLFHEAALYGMRRGDDTRQVIDGQSSCPPLNAHRTGFGANHFITLRFFWIQAVGLLLEDLYRQLTDRKVSGHLGRLWTFTFLIWFAGGLYKTWSDHGFLQGWVSLRTVCESIGFISVVNRLIIEPFFLGVDTIAEMIR